MINTFIKLTDIDTKETVVVNINQIGYYVAFGVINSFICVQGKLIQVKESCIEITSKIENIRNLIHIEEREKQRNENNKKDI